VAVFVVSPGPFKRPLPSSQAGLETLEECGVSNPMHPQSLSRYNPPHRRLSQLNTSKIKPFYELSATP
jgi:hypothetical protein